MAQRRMFSLQVVDTDAFMDMPLSAQALYFHLSMRADDDGFIDNARRIQKLLGAADDDLRILIAKGFILAFDSGVIVVKHWKISNYIQKDRYKPTQYQEEKSTLSFDLNGAYTDCLCVNIRPCIQPVSKLAFEPVSTLDTELDTDRENPVAPRVFGDVSTLDTQVRLHSGGGDRNIINNFSGGGDNAGAREEAKSVVAAYMGRRDLDSSIFFGVTEQTLATVAAYTDAIFAKLSNRSPTDADRASVFRAIHQSQQDNLTGAWNVSFPQNRVELLLYAFEQAALSGKPGDWNYINGVLKRLTHRGISTLSQAEDYDFERECERFPSPPPWQRISQPSLASQKGWKYDERRSDPVGV